MRYKEYARENGSAALHTGIHTQINNDYRISSVYRRFSNPYFETWAWETFLWKGDKIENQYNTLQNADNVIDLHMNIFKEFINEM